MGDARLNAAVLREEREEGAGVLKAKRARPRVEITFYTLSTTGSTLLLHFSSLCF